MLTIGIPKAWWGGGVDLEFPQGTDTSVFLENAFEKAIYPNGKKVNDHGILRA